MNLVNRSVSCGLHFQSIYLGKHECVTPTLKCTRSFYPHSVWATLWVLYLSDPLNKCISKMRLVTNLATYTTTTTTTLIYYIVIHSHAFYTAHMPLQPTVVGSSLPLSFMVTWKLCLLIACLSFSLTLSLQISRLRCSYSL